MTTSDTPAAAPDPTDEAPPPPSASGWRWLHRALRTTGWLLGTTLLLLMLGLGLVLGTQGGLRFAVALVQDLAPGMLTVGTLDGRILGRLHVADLALRLPGLEVDLGEARLDWSPSALLTGTLRVADLTVRDINIATAPGDPNQPFTLPEIRLPLGIEIEHGLVERLRVQTIGAAPASALVIDHLVLSATALADRVAIRQLDARLSQPALTATATGEGQLTGAWPINLTLDWQFSPLPADDGAPPVPPVLTGTGQVRGDLTELHIEHRLSGAIDATLTATVRDALTAPAWDGQVRIASVDLPALVPGTPPIQFTATLATAGSLAAAGLTGSIDASAPTLPDLGGLNGEIDIQWAGQQLHINRLRVQETADGDTQARIDLAGLVDLKDLQAPVFDLTGGWAELRWPLAGGTPLADSPAGRLTIKGGLDGAEVQITADAAGPQVPATTIVLTARASRDQMQLQGLDLATLGGRLTLTGTVQLTPALSWDLKLTGRDLDPGRQYPGRNGRITIDGGSQGNLDDGFGYDLRVAAALADYPKALLTARGSGTSSAIGIDSLRVETGNGRIDGSGRVTLTPVIGWEVTLTASNLDPGLLSQDWPGRIGGRIASRGQMTADGADLTARIDGLGGQLRGYPVRVDAALSQQGQTLVLEQFSAASGPSRLSASGRVGTALDLNFDLRSPDLATALPQARGSLTASGRVTGTPAAPTLALNLDGQRLGFQDQRVGRLSGTVNAGLARNAPLAVALTASDITAGGQHYDTLTLNADGSLARHRVAAALNGPSLKVNLASEGALSEAGAYRGSLTRLDVAPTGFGPFALQRPAPISLNGPRISAGPLCLTLGSSGAPACARYEQTATGRFTATLDAQRIALALLNPLLPETVAASGFARANARFAGSGGTLTGSARLELPEGAATLILPGQDERLVFNGTRVDLTTNPRGLEARLALPIAGLGQVAGEVSLPGFPPGSGPSQPLRGSVTARVESFARFAHLVPDVTNLTGSLSADLRLGGTLGAPTIGGNAALREVGLKIPITGTEVKALTLNASGRGGDGFTISGSALVGGGRLDLAGDAAGLLGGKPTIAFTLRGERLKLADSREYFALASLDIRGDQSPAGIAITGDISIPEARIMPRAIPAGAILPSRDVVIMGTRERGPALPLSIDVRVRLGNKVQIDAFGLRGRLTGGLRVLKQPRGDLVGDGQLAVVDGTFRVSLPGLGLVTAIGAPLNIEQGIVNFAGTSLTDPGLVLNAVRQGGDLTAGVQVLGTLQSPQLAFFSESDPNMSQAEITKYLVTGIPPRRDGDGADNRALSVGTYVAPRLFVEYENSLAGQSDKVKLRYELNDRVELQTETGGGAQGGDIFFKFEN